MSDISEMPAGWELDALVAERVMGLGESSWEPPCEKYHNTDDCEGKDERLGWTGWCYTCNCMIDDAPRCPLRYSTDIATAWLVWEWLQEHNPWRYPGGNPATLFLMKNEGVWSVGVMTDYWDGGIPGEGTLRDGNFAIVGPTAPLAICRAALRVVK